MGRTSAPTGFYTAAQAIKKMGLPKSTFYDMVEQGKVQRVVPPNRSDGFYLKSEIDKLSKPYELFVLQYATDTSAFEKATKEDIADITELSIELFGKNGTASQDQRANNSKKAKKMLQLSSNTTKQAKSRRSKNEKLLHSGGGHEKA